MQEFSQSDQDRTRESIELFELLLQQKRETYFDVYQIEHIFDYYYEKGKFKMAEKAIDMGLRCHPDSSTLLLKQSTLLIESGELDKSLKILTFLENLESNNSEVFLNLGIIYNLKKNRKQAIAYYEKALKLVGIEDLKEYIFEISFNLNQQGFYTDAKNLLKYYQNITINSENLLFEQAFAHDKLDEIEEGIRIYNSLLNKNPYLENAWYNLGILYNKKEEYDKAIHAYNMTLTIDAELAEAHYNKANSLAQIGQFREALDSYIDYITNSFYNAITFYYMGDCWENLGNYSYAHRFYKLASELNPNHIESLEGLGRTAYKTKDYQTSIIAFDKALDINPQSSDLWLYLGKSHRKAHNLPQAKHCLKKALIHKSEDTLNWIEMYQFLEENEIDFQPIPFLKKLLAKDKNNGALHYLAAIIYNKYQNHNESLSHLVIARQLLPDDLNLVLNEYPQLINIPKIAEYINSHL